MKNLFFILIIFFTANNLYAQKRGIITTTGSAQVEFPDFKSKLEVEKEAENLTRSDALERAFGKVIIQGNSTYIKNINSGEKVETNSSFSMIANTYVKGEIIEILNKKFTAVKGIKIIDKNEVEITDIRCDIKLKSRELTELPIEFEVSTLSYPDKR